jgi:hypothetical protein
MLLASCWWKCTTRIEVGSESFSSLSVVLVFELIP